MRGIEQYLQVDAATLGALKYAGTWNASTNTPTLASGVGTQGQYYVVSVAGSTNLDGETNWQVGDWAVFNGSVWQKVDGGSTGLLTTLTVTGNTYLATTSGNVGVGTTSPGAKLDVSGGDIRLATNATYYRSVTSGGTSVRMLGINAGNGRRYTRWHPSSRRDVEKPVGHGSGTRRGVDVTCGGDAEAFGVVGAEHQYVVFSIVQTHFCATHVQVTAVTKGAPRGVILYHHSTKRVCARVNNYGCV